jgi:hypothetical protein
MYAITDFLRRHVRHYSVKYRLRARARSDKPMDEVLLSNGFAEIGDIVQSYCDHPPALTREWHDGDCLHRDCKCGTYLGVVEE